MVLLQMPIARSWSARGTLEGARAYTAYFQEVLAPQLARIAGHRGALLLHRTAGDAVEITVHTFWESMASVERFAGASYNRAVVEPEARALLTSFDEHVEHREVALDTHS
jgi:heme-degrading monooxygenase HmoA